jgi:SAM-dependent methyltransferase
VKLLRIIQYTGYVAFHWGIRVGFYTMWHEIRGELKYGINTSGSKVLTASTVKGTQLEHATEYMPVNYSLLESLLRTLPPEAKAGTFFDMGCGSGRALCVAARFGFQKVAGIDFDEELISLAAENLAATKRKIPQLDYDIAWCDLDEWELSDEISVLFLFNPFDDSLIQLLIRKIQKGLRNNPRPFWVLYASPRHTDRFLEAGFIPGRRIKKAGFIEGVLLKSES